MTAIDWTKFTKKIKINSTLETVYNHWVTPELLCKWFLRDAIIISENNTTKPTSSPAEQNDTYIWKWHNYDGEEQGTVLVTKPNHYFEFSFAEETTKVSISLKEVGNSVLLELCQYNMATDDATKHNLYYGCSNGWTFWLTNLKAYLEYGILLHDTELGNLDDKNSCGEYVNT
ncbi:MAG: SRPBCC family protein [Flavobacteriaceae bacterium]